MGQSKKKPRVKKNPAFYEFHFRTPIELAHKFIEEAGSDDRSAVSLWRRILTERYQQKGSSNA